MGIETTLFTAQGQIEICLMQGSLFPIQNNRLTTVYFIPDPEISRFKADIYTKLNKVEKLPLHVVSTGYLALVRHTSRALSTTHTLWSA